MLPLDLGAEATDIGRSLLARLDQIAADATTWEDATGGQVANRVTLAHLAIEEAVEREVQRAEQELADAPLAQERVRQYAARQRQLYADGDYLRTRMLLRGAVDSEDDLGDSSGAAIREVLPKRPFTSLERGTMVIESRSSATQLALQQLYAAYRALLDRAEPMDGETSVAAVQAIAQLRRDGHEPDAVLLPRDPRRATLSEHPEWQWTHDHHLATLSGVPVYAAGPANAATLVVADLGASLRRVEHRRPGDPSPVRITVETINQERAAQLWDEGERPTGNHGDRAAQEAALVRGYVETHIAIDVEWRNPHHTEPAAWRIELPPVGHRRAPGE